MNFEQSFMIIEERKAVSGEKSDAMSMNTKGLPFFSEVQDVDLNVNLLR